MNKELIEKLILAAPGLDDHDQFYAVMEALADAIPYRDWLRLEDAVNLRVGRAIEAAFKAGMVAGASRQQ